MFTEKMFTVGQKVFANYQMYGKMYPGKIAGLNDDDTYNVQYDDGDFERRVRPCALQTST